MKRGIHIIMIFPICALITAGAAQAQDPSVVIDTNKDSYYTNETLSASVTFSNPGEETQVDVYAAVVAPDGSIFMLPGLTAYPPLVPWRSSFALPEGYTGSETLPPSPFTMTTAFPAGAYTFAAGLAAPGTAQFFLPVSTKTVSFLEPLPRREDEAVYVDTYDPAKACNGTTLLTDTHDSERPRIIEVNMEGEIVWEYAVPDNLRRFINPGFDAELLSNGNVLFVLPFSGIYEIDREGGAVWTHLDSEVTHDADRLPDGNTIYVFGGWDTKDKAQVKEVNPQGQIVWSWYARDQFSMEPYLGIEWEGWTHTNAVTRLDNGNTLISLRNFNLTVEVDPQGTVVWSYDWSTVNGFSPHEPEILPDDHLLICLQGQTPHQAVEIDRSTGRIVWDYYRPGLRTARDCDRLPNGNTLILGVLVEGEESVIFEVTPQGEIVWELKLQDAPVGNRPGWFYKAQRTCEG